MRRGYKFIRVRRGEEARTDVDQSVSDFAETMGYGKRRYPTREAFLESFGAEWILELRAALRVLLQQDRTILSIGSGECEHEIPFFLEGYRITGSDIVPETLSQTRQLFPDFPAIVFDIFNPSFEKKYDDILIPGLDFYFADRAQMIFDNARGLLNPGGRLLFTLRYQDNPATWTIDYVGLPLACFALDIRERLRGSGDAYRLKLHGYRRRRAEIVAMGEKAGFRLGRVRAAGFGGELTRLAIHRLFPRFYSWARRLDRRLQWFNTATVFEFLT